MLMLCTRFVTHVDDATRGAPIRVRGVVVVGVACGVDIPHIVSVTSIRRTQTAVLCLQPTPHIHSPYWGEYRFLSLSRHPLIRFLTLTALSVQ